MKHITFLAVLALLLSACTNATLPTSTSTPTEPASTTTATETPTAAPTATPVPAYDVTVQAFHDYNGNGIMDQDEPPLEGIMNSAGDTDCTTGDDGICTLEGLSVGKQTIKVRASENFTHILPSTSEVNKIDQGLIIDINDDTTVNIPLAEGFHTLPMACEQDSIPDGYFDHDPTSNVRDYKGDTRVWEFGVFKGTENGHTGLDYKLPIGIPLYATAPGTIVEIGSVPYPGRSDRIFIIIDHGSDVYPRFSGYNHVDKPVVEIGKHVDRGDIIATSGISGASWSHLHFDLGYGTFNNYASVDPYADELNPNSTGYWTVKNKPVCLPNL